MDVSSKYFSLLKRPSPYWVKYAWLFMVDIYRVGKLRELCSFVLWEVNHRIRLYQLGKRYLTFTDNAYLSLAGDSTSLIHDADSSLFLVQQGLQLKPVSIDWKFCAETTDGTLWGCCFSHPETLYRSIDQSESATPIQTFPYAITSLFISRSHSLFVCSNGTIYKSDDLGVSFRIVLHLSTPVSYFLFNNGMTELPDNTLLIGEYGSIWHGRAWQNLAYLYHSTDGGDTWRTADFLKQQGVNKHIHLVKYCTRLNAIFLTDGDNKKQVWMNASLAHFNKQGSQRKAGWRLLNKYHHQTGGYTSMVETDNTVLLGSDYLGGTNFIVQTSDGRRFTKLVLPDPYRRSPVMNMIARHASAGTELWASSYSCLSTRAKSLLMCTTDAGKTWARVIEFDGTKNEVRFASSSASPSGTLYISVTKFGEGADQHSHRVYKLENRIRM